MSERIIADKKEQLLRPQKSKLPLFICAIMVIVVVGFILNMFRDQKNVHPTGASGSPVAAPRSYVGKVVQMKTIKPNIEDGKIKIPLAEVDTHNMVAFELENSEGFLVPMMAYITSSGRFFVGSSLCECKGRKFSLAGEALVCNTCRTTYTIEDQEFISGAAICGEYPPIKMKAVVENGMIVLAQSEILQWRVRE